ncbi:MAG: O-antigen ligase family protein [Elusimicrobia bacterium]|nr:O-antigen ligase family protein [Elusimicrobiota bacterium]
MRDSSRWAPPEWLLESLLLSAVVFGPLAFGAVEPWSVAVLEGLLFTLGLLCLWRGFRSWDHLAYKTLVPAAAFILLIGVLQYLNPRPLSAPAGLLPATVSRTATGRELVLWSAYAVLLLCVPQVLSSRAAVRRFAWTVLCLGTAIAIIGIIQRGTGNTAYFGLRPVRHHAEPFGPYTNKNHAASMMAMCACLGFGVVSTRLLRLRREAGMGRLFDLAAIQCLLYFLVAVTLFGVIRAGSRGGTHALVAAVFVTGLLAASFVERRWLRWLWRGALLCGVAGFGAFVWAHQAWIGWVLQSPDNATAYRLSMYESGWQMFRDFPIFGVGLGGIKDSFVPYQDSLIPGLVDHIHNDWLEVLLQTGLAGFAVLALGFGAFLWRGTREWLASPSREARLLAAGALAAVACFLFQSLVEFNFQIPANAVLFLSVLSLLNAQGLVAKTGHD